MCHFAMGLTHCYKTTVFYIYLCITTVIYMLALIPRVIHKKFFSDMYNLCNVPSTSGDFASPRPSPGALPLDPAGGLPSPYPFQNWTPLGPKTQHHPLATSMSRLAAVIFKLVYKLSRNPIIMRITSLVWIFKEESEVIMIFKSCSALNRK